MKYNIRRNEKRNTLTIVFSPVVFTYTRFLYEKYQDQKYFASGILENQEYNEDILPFIKELVKHLNELGKGTLPAGEVFSVSDKTVALVIKKYSYLAGLDSSKYAGHSLRSGFATSAAESGAEERSIMAMTGHKSTEMVRRYIKEANLFKNNALNKIKL